VERSRTTRIARALSGPVRNYVNRHSEALKDEVRRDGMATRSQMAASTSQVETNTAECVAALSRQVDELDRRLAEIHLAVRQMAAVLAADAERPDGPLV